MDRMDAMDLMDSGRAVGEEIGRANGSPGNASLAGGSSGVASAGVRRRRFGTGARIAVAVASLLISACGLEVAYRIFTTLRHRATVASFQHELYVLDPDDDVAYTLRPGVSRTNKIPGFDEGDWSYEIGPDGLRARPTSSPTPPSNPARRILVLGDSYTFGWALDQSLEPFPAVLERLLNDRAGAASTLVVNAGIPGYGTVQEERLLERMLEADAPDMVVLAYVMNDAEPQLTVPPSPRALNRDAWLWLPGRIAEGLNRLAPADRPFLPASRRRYDFDYRKGFAPGSPKGRESMESLGRMAALCRARGIEFAVFVLPDFSREFGDAYPYAGIHETVMARARELDVPAFDLLPRFRALDSKALRVPEDLHPNAEGHRLIAEAMAEGIESPIGSRGKEAGRPGASTPDAPPNILWIVADDLSAEVFGAYGSKRARTPNLDRLAASGVRFERAYCNSPVCTASRQSFLTGRLPSDVGVTLLKTPLPDEAITLAELLGPRGYATAAIGKMHFNRPSTPGLHGFDLLLDTPDAEAIIRARGGPAPVDPAIRVQPPWKPFRDPARVWLNSEALPVGRHEPDMPGSIFAERSIEFLEERAADGRPFLLMTSFTEPHSPFHFPVEYAGRFDPADFDPPEPGPDDDARIPEEFRDLTRDEKRGIVAAYHTSVEFLDSLAGRVLDALERTGLAERTLVVFMGDHGYSLGHHGRFEKHCFHEPAVRAPLVMRWPGVTRAGGTTTALVEFLDVFPTLALACGADPRAGGATGIDLRPLLSVAQPGVAAPGGRDAIFSEYCPNDEMMAFGGRYKLIRASERRERDDGYRTGRPLPSGPTLQLYDRESDPGEVENLAGRPEHAARVESLMREIARRLGEANAARDPDGAREAASPDTPPARIEELVARWSIPPEERAVIPTPEGAPQGAQAR